MSVELRVQGAHQLRELSKALKEAGRGDLRRKMLQGIRSAARPVVAEVKSAARSIPAEAPHGTLRREMAAATGLQARQDGVRIRVNTKRLGGRHKLPRYLDDPKGWRHPVFGRRKNPQDWQHQAGHPWFRTTIERHAGELRGAVVKVLDDIAAELERSV